MRRTMISAKDTVKKLGGFPAVPGSEGGGSPPSTTAYAVAREAGLPGDRQRATRRRRRAADEAGAIQAELETAFRI